LVEGVGHDPSAGPTIPTQVGFALERGVDPDAAGERQECGQVDHAVGGGAGPHPGAGGGAFFAVHDRSGVEAGGDRRGGALDAGVAHRRQRGLVGAHLGVE